MTKFEQFKALPPEEQARIRLENQAAQEQSWADEIKLIEDEQEEIRRMNKAAWARADLEASL